MIQKDLIKDDLYAAVNGEWLKKAVIPEDRPRIGGFTDLVIGVEDTLIKDFNELKDPKDVQMKEFLKYYNMTKDFKTRNKDGLKDIKKYIEKIEKLKDFSDLQELNKEWTLKGFDLLYDFSVYPDMSDATTNVLYLGIPSIILPEKGYYDENNEDGKRLIEVYKGMLDKILDIYSYSKEEKEKLINNTIAFDKMMAKYIKTSVELADYPKLNNPRTMEEVNKYSKVLNFEKIVFELIEAKPEKIIVEQPVFYEAYNEFVNENNFELIKSWLIIKLILGESSNLTSELKQLGGIYGRALSGTSKELPIEKYAYYHATSMFSEVISVYYGEKYFGKLAKKDVKEMVESMIKVYEKRLNENTWLKEETRKYAIKKLETLEILVGYPEIYDEVYNKLKVDENDTFFNNTIKMTEIFVKHALEKWNKPVKRLEWGMSSNTVNAYYNPSLNHICFPAAILQKPFYSLDQSKSENYGGIGAVIGHEISHAFDNNGSQFDAEGNMKNWWTKEDYEIFDNKAKAMIELFDGIAFGKGKINGKLTVSENIADAGGLSCALEALKNSGENNYQDFFINWARIWRIKARPEYMDMIIKIDVHAPGELRANIQPRNLDEFYKAFDIKETDKMYLEPKKRVNIW
ncbi:M13 family metallopeptidase [Sneathia sanguinegens]|uniref:M13-type metalloendopeptidase n=1 Tax=Sneathia sanguinegens TaxID=40543 RepID=A0ABT7HI98_9FUSO|nr:M13-type metalloendopeptidase [Sneathia sanguinegens]MDK9580243.1 M13-type metalloendopeptidase [Sneathia sanguinegens]